jgi:hypothetical protein
MAYPIPSIEFYQRVEERLGKDIATEVSKMLETIENRAASKRS